MDVIRRMRMSVPQYSSEPVHGSALRPCRLRQAREAHHRGHDA